MYARVASKVRFDVIHYMEIRRYRTCTMTIKEAVVMGNSKSLLNLSKMTGISVSKLVWADALTKAPRCTATVEEARERYYNTPDDSYDRCVALEKWISLCVTLDEACEVYRVTQDESETQRAVLHKIIEIYMKR